MRLLIFGQPKYLQNLRPLTGMKTETAIGIRLKKPATQSLRYAFGILWLTDLIATLFLFLVPYATELNPLTTHLYNAVGLPGVILAGTAYAGLVVVAGHLLSKPVDSLFVLGVISVYAVCATNNVILLLFRRPLIESLIL
ncbi:hypothetical protein [Natrinema gelatinilyticum]|uniref:hypothetical protein n=1 Tax=Natrinema gelatinilyticum TaxID=2961571 RepID=UPI0020C2962D|nr:hypothetical protein [Natrinema gelatinilyticum]